MDRIFHGFDGNIQDIEPIHAQILKTLSKRDPRPVGEIMSSLSMSEVERERLQPWIEEMIRGEFVVPYDFDKDMDLKKRQEDVLRRHGRTKPRELYLFLANSCNQACKYCYVPEGMRMAADKRMSEETMKTAVAEFFATASANGEKYVELRLLGGEPLWEFDMFKRTIEYAKHEANEFGITFKVIVNTNGTLIDESNIKWIEDNRDILTFVISLDGGQQQHDKFRVFRDGTGTFDRVMNGIRLLSEHEVENYPHSVIGTHNTGDFERFIRGLSENNIRYLSFSFMYAPTQVQREMGIFELDPRAKMDFFKHAHGLAKQLEMEITGHWKFAVGHLIKGAPFMCRGATHSICVTSDGDTYPCQRLVGNEDFLLGQVSPGFIGRINFTDNEAYRRWIHGSAVFNSSCAGCKFIGVHSGGCPHETNRTGHDKASQGSGSCDCQFNLGLLSYFMKLPIADLRFTEFDRKINGMIYDGE